MHNVTSNVCHDVCGILMYLGVRRTLLHNLHITQKHMHKSPLGIMCICVLIVSVNKILTI